MRRRLNNGILAPLAVRVNRRGAESTAGCGGMLHENLPPPATCTAPCRTSPPCDLLLLGGDLCPVSNHDVAFQAEWLDTTFRRWLEAVPARQVVGVAGNHDFVFERFPISSRATCRWTYLQDSGLTWEGLHLWGTPWQPWFFDWAFNLYEPDLVAKWAMIPRGHRHPRPARPAARLRRRRAALRRDGPHRLAVAAEADRRGRPAPGDLRPHPRGAGRVAGRADDARQRHDPR